MFKRVDYGALNARQKENRNFHKIAARLADYGYHSMRLSDDFRGADFIALHIDGETLLRVQLKARMTFDAKYLGKGLHLAFLEGPKCFVYPHDDTLEAVDSVANIRQTESWRKRGLYHWPSLPKKIEHVLMEYEI